jgi:hypothetical protein
VSRYSLLARRTRTPRELSRESLAEEALGRGSRATPEQMSQPLPQDSGAYSPK